MQLIKRTPEEIIKAVVKWQSLKCVHPLTCGNNSCHQLLIAVRNCKEEVYLICLDCDYTQDHIPEVVMNCLDLKITYSDKNNIEHLRRK
jgi:hypothetical protein